MMNDGFRARLTQRQIELNSVLCVGPGSIAISASSSIDNAGREHENFQDFQATRAEEYVRQFRAAGAVCR